MSYAKLKIRRLIVMNLGVSGLLKINWTRVNVGHIVSLDIIKLDVYRQRLKRVSYMENI